jgi:class 3 adenylate cyclase
MTVLRARAIMKTDIRGSTLQFRMLSEVDLETLLTEHRQFVSRVAKAHDGRVGSKSPRLAGIEVYRLGT